MSKMSQDGFQHIWKNIDPCLWVETKILTFHLFVIFMTCIKHEIHFTIACLISMLKIASQSDAHLLSRCMWWR